MILEQIAVEKSLLKIILKETSVFVSLGLYLLKDQNC